MPWNRPTLDSLKTRVEGDVTSKMTGGVPLLRFSVLKILASALAGVVHILHGYLFYLSKQILPTTAEGIWLDAHASSWGLSRNAATFAAGAASVTGSNGNIIPAGTIYIASSGVTYAVSTQATISGGVATLALSALTAGEIGNLPAGSTLTAQSPVAGVNGTATTSAGLTGGVNQELDESLRERILARIKSPAAGGSATDYVAWARSVSGVGKAWCFPNYYGLGTVAVVITASGDDPVPSGGLVTQVQTYIDTVRPVTAVVTVSAITAVDVDLTLDIDPDLPEIETAITGSLEDFFESEAAPGGILYISRLGRAIAVSGINDYEISEMDVGGISQPIENYQFTGFQFPVLGDITYQAL